MSDWCRRVRDLRADLSVSARLLLFALASHADAEGYAWPSVKLLGEETNLARSTIFKALDELMGKPLEEGGPARLACIAMVQDGHKKRTWQLLISAPDSVRHVDHSPRRQPNPEPAGAANGPRDGLNSVHVVDHQSTRRTEHGPSGGQASIRWTGQSTSRTHTVRLVDSHLEVPIEESMKGSSGGGAVPMAPPPDERFCTPEWEAAVRGADPTYVNEATAARERMAVNTRLGDLGFRRNQAAAIWLALVDRWATTGERPSHALRGAQHGIDPAFSDEANAAIALRPLAAAMAGEARCG